MQNNSFLKLILPLLVIFILVNSLISIFTTKFLALHISPVVLMTANCILFFVSILCLALHLKAMKNPNQNVMIRSIMLSTIIKLMTLATATVIYIFIERKNVSVYAIVCSMGLYIIYTFLEVKIALKLNNKNGNK